MTAQFPDRIAYRNQVIPLASCPLSQYAFKADVRLPFLSLNSANWRGYIASWELLDNRLYLKGIRGNLNNELVESPAQWVLDFEDESDRFLPPPLSLEVLFPGYPNGVFAHWFTGQLRCPRGALIKYKHMGFDSIYENDLLLTIHKGILAKTETKINEDASYDSP